MDFFERIQGMLGDTLLSEEVRAALERGSAALSRKDYDTAEREAVAALAKAPESGRAHALAGFARKGKGELARARTSLREATHKTPGDAAVHLALAELELALGDPARALLEAKKAREVGAPLGESTLCLARAHVGRGELREAATAIEAVPEAQRPFEAQVLLGEVWLQLGAADAARGAFEALAARAPQHVDALFGLARARLALGDVRAALEPALRALSEAPTRAALVSFVGAVHGALGNPQGEAAAYARALELDPRDLRATRGTAQLSLTAGDPARAEALFQKALEIDAKDAESERGLARARLAAKVATEALAREADVQAASESALRPDDLYGLILRAQRLCDESPELAETAAALSRLRVGYDRPLSLAIAGEFNAGKSTLLNALVGDAVAPMGVTPTTAAVNVFVYGATRGARAVLRDGRVEEVPMERVASLVDARHGAGDGAVQHVEIVWPAEPLREVSLVDTPGFNAADEQHEAVARGFLAQADAVLWIFDASHAGSASERGAIEALGPLRGKVIGVVNKADRLSADERVMVLDFLRTGFGAEVSDWTFVSARDALAARRDGSEAALEQSGFPALWRLLDERFFTRARAEKKVATHRRVAPLLRGALDTLRGATERTRIATERAHARRAGAATLERSLVEELAARIEGGWQTARRRVLVETAQDAADVARRRSTSFTSLIVPKLADADLEFLSRVTGDRLQGALEQLGRDIAADVSRKARAEVEAWRAPHDDSPRAELSTLVAWVERATAEVADELRTGPFAAAAAYLRGWLDGGRFAHAAGALAKAQTPAEAERALDQVLPSQLPWRQAWQPWARGFAGRFVELAEVALRICEHEAATGAARLHGPLQELLERLRAMPLA